MNNLFRKKELDSDNPRQSSDQQMQSYIDQNKTTVNANTSPDVDNKGAGQLANDNNIKTTEIESWGQDWTDDEVDKVEQLSKNVSSEMGNLKKQMEDLAKSLQNNLLQMFNTNNKVLLHYLEKIMNDQAQTVADTLKINENVESVIGVQQYTIRQQHDTILRFQSDLLLKSQKDIIMEMIGIADQIQYIIDDQKLEKNYDKLIEDIKGLGKWVDASLNTVAVRSYSDIDGFSNNFDSKRQEVVDVEETPDSASNGLFVSKLPGYIWSIPWLVVNSQVNLEKLVSENNRAKMFEFVLRPQQIVKLRYVESKNNRSEIEGQETQELKIIN